MSGGVLESGGPRISWWSSAWANVYGLGVVLVTLGGTLIVVWNALLRDGRRRLGLLCADDYDLDLGFPRFSDSGG
jgi:hypothetical protein